MSDVTEFDAVTLSLRPASPLEVMCDEAADELHAQRGEDAPIGSEEIVARAWELLPERERDDALDELYFTFRQAQLTSRVDDKRREREQPIRLELAALIEQRRQAARFKEPVPVPLLEQIAALTAVLIGGGS